MRFEPGKTYQMLQCAGHGEGSGRRCLKVNLDRYLAAAAYNMDQQYRRFYTIITFSWRARALSRYGNFYKQISGLPAPAWNTG